MADTELAKRLARQLEHEFVMSRLVGTQGAAELANKVEPLLAAALSAARAEAMKEVEREARTWPIIGGLVAKRFRALAAGQGGEE